MWLVFVSVKSQRKTAVSHVSAKYPLTTLENPSFEVHKTAVKNRKEQSFDVTKSM